MSKVITGIFNDVKDTKPYSDEELRTRSEREYARPWSRVFATLYSFSVRLKKIEDKLNDRE